MKKRDIEPGLLTTREVARYLGCSEDTLNQWRSRGVQGLPFVRLGRRMVRYRPSDVKRFVDGGWKKESD